MSVGGAATGEQLTATATIQLYGPSQSRAGRVVWMLKELGLDFQLHAMFPGDDPAHDAVNQNRKVPFLVDRDGTHVFESLGELAVRGILRSSTSVSHPPPHAPLARSAINLYLIERYGGSEAADPHHFPAAPSPLAPRSAQERAALLAWSFFAMTELDGRLMEAIMHSPRMLHPLAHPKAYAHYFDHQKSPERLARLWRELVHPLQALDRAVAAGGGWLVGGRFTAADLNVASVLWWILVVDRAALAGLPRLSGWLTACLAREHSPTQKRNGAQEAIPAEAFKSVASKERMMRSGSPSFAAAAKL